MKKPRFLIDVDDVLCDFKTPALGLMQSLFGHKVVLEDMEVWDIFEELPLRHREELDAELSKPGYCTNLEPHPGTLEAISALRELTHVVIVTAPYMSPTWMHERVLWLESRFGFARRDIVITEGKFLVGGGFFLDDKPLNVSEWAEEHPQGEAMLWATPNTNKMSDYDPFRVRSWDEVIARVQARLK